MAKKPPFTKQELIDYVTERGYIADYDAWFLWYERNGFCYLYGKHLFPLKNWKSDVNMKLRNKSFNARPIPKPVEPKPKEPEAKPEIATLEQRRRIKEMLCGIGKKPNYGFRSSAVTEQRRQMNARKLENG